jgi:hypothetical protein
VEDDAVYLYQGYGNGIESSIVNGGTSRVSQQVKDAELKVPISANSKNHTFN